MPGCWELDGPACCAAFTGLGEWLEPGPLGRPLGSQLPPFWDFDPRTPALPVPLNSDLCSLRLDSAWFCLAPSEPRGLEGASGRNPGDSWQGSPLLFLFSGITAFCGLLSGVTSGFTAVLITPLQPGCKSGFIYLFIFW